jgi:hypothetical protein
MPETNTEPLPYQEQLIHLLNEMLGRFADTNTKVAWPTIPVITHDGRMSQRGVVEIKDFAPDIFRRIDYKGAISNETSASYRERFYRLGYHSNPRKEPKLLTWSHEQP